MKKKPIYQRTWFIVLAVLILVPAISNAFTSDEQSPVDQISSRAQETAAPSESQTTKTATPSTTSAPKTEETKTPQSTEEPSESSDKTQAEEASSQETEPVAEDVRSGSDGCIAISARLFESLNTGIQDVQASNSVLKAMAFRAPGRASVWFIAAEVQGPGIGAGDAVGVWATNSGVEDNDFGSLFSIDGIANAFSSWGSTEGTSIEISRFEDGVQESRECLG